MDDGGRWMMEEGGWWKKMDDGGKWMMEEGG